MQRIKNILILTLSVLWVTTNAQDADLSHFYVSPSIASPALTGRLTNDDFRAVGVFRSQWSSLASNYVTSAFSFDVPYKKKWGIGGYILNNDGARVFNVLNVVVSGSYDILKEDQDKHHLVMGLNLGIINKKIDSDEFTYDAQYDDGFFNPYINSNEEGVGQSKILPEVAYGVAYYNTDDQKKYHPFVSASVFHLTYPKESFTNTSSRLPLRYSVMAGSNFEINEKINAKPLLFWQYQRRNTYLNFGAEGSFQIEDKGTEAIAGLFYRLNESIIPMVGIQYQNIVFRFSYDINTSSLNDFTQRRGGVEFSLTFQGDSGNILGFAVPR